MVYHECNLNEVNFIGTALKGVDLSNSSFQQLSVSLENLKGCEVSTEQAIGFAVLMGLKIKG